MELLAVTVSAALVLPYGLRQARLAPVAGISLWVAVLTLRALVTVSLVLIGILLLPATEIFQLLTHWCLHAVVPFFMTHFGLDGHRIGDAAVLVPAVVVAASGCGAGIAIWRAARRVRRWLQSCTVGTGPRASVIVGGDDVLVATAGIRAPRVVVSAGALLQLDDAELVAGLEHEWGHINRHHRLLSVAGQLLRAVSWPLPGGARALELLRFHLERDADDFAVERTGDPAALARAICKAMKLPQSPVVLQLAEAGVVARLALLADDAHKQDSASTATALVTTALAVGLSLLLLSAIPDLAQASASQMGGFGFGDLGCPE